jgi:3-dehydroquinate synthase
LNNHFDIPFQVSFTHQLRFTQDCFGSDWQVLASLLQGSGEQSAKVQVWLDSGLTVANPDLLGHVHRRFLGEPSIELVSDVSTLPGGEVIKNDSSYVEQILQAIDRDALDRRSYVVAIGGGAVLDAVGFAAAVAHRGIRLIRVPSTTLAQADSGVGVKNAVNAFQKKNWKGTFSVPWAVVNDQRLLESQPDREFLCGFSEAVKVSLLKSHDSFRQIAADAEKIANRDIDAALRAVRSSVLLHLDHITLGGDPFELLEARPLDFGHWSAHKLEALTNYELRHGEAVAIGVALDTIYSSLALGLDPAVVTSVVDTLRQLRLPVFHKKLLDPEVFSGLEEFRQHLGGRLTLTMLQSIGNPIDVHEVDLRKMKQAISRLQELSETRSISVNHPPSESSLPQPHPPQIGNRQDASCQTR